MVLPRSQIPPVLSLLIRFLLFILDWLSFFDDLHLALLLVLGVEVGNLIANLELVLPHSDNLSTLLGLLRDLLDLNRIDFVSPC